MGAILGIVVGRIPSMWAIILIGTVIAGCICLLWFSRAVEKEATSQMVLLIERCRPLHRLSEEEMLTEGSMSYTFLSRRVANS